MQPAVAAVRRGSFLSRIRLFVDRCVSRPLFPSLVLAGNVVFNLSSFVRTIIDSENIPSASEVLYLLVSSVLIRVALIVMAAILCLMLMVLRGERKIVTTCKMLLLSAGVVAYHLNMLHYACSKWTNMANDFLFYSLIIPLITVYTVHAAVQMETIFANLKCLRDEEIKLCPKSVSLLSILFNITMISHFFCILSSWNREKDCLYMFILFGFEFVHRMLALKTFLRLLWLHLNQHERLRDNEELTRAFEETDDNSGDSDQFYVADQQPSLTRHQSVPVVSSISLPQEPQEDKLYTTATELLFLPLSHKQSIVV